MLLRYLSVCAASRASSACCATGVKRLPHQSTTLLREPAGSGVTQLTEMMVSQKWMLSMHISGCARERQVSPFRLAAHTDLDPAKALVRQLEDLAHPLSGSGIAQPQALLHCTITGHRSHRHAVGTAQQ